MAGFPWQLGLVTTLDLEMPSLVAQQGQGWLFTTWALDAIGNVFDAAVPAKLQIATKTITLSAIEDSWGAPGKPRIVVAIPLGL